MDNERPLRSVPDDELLRRLGSLVHQSRAVEHDLVAHIAEVDARKLYAREAYPSMFVYCTNVLHLSDAEAYLRIAAARASLLHPVILTLLADGRLNLTSVNLIRRHLTPDNRDVLLARAAHRSKRQILKLIAEIAPRPDVPAVMRKLPERRMPPQQSVPSPVAAPTLELCPDTVVPPAPPVAEAVPPMPTVRASVAASPMPVPALELCPKRVEHPALVLPLSPARYKVQFTAGARLHDLLERLRGLMRSTVADPDLATLIEIAVAEKVERLEARRFGKTKAPRTVLSKVDPNPFSRYVPAEVKRIVSERDGYQCCFRESQAERCPERGNLEFHHQHPYGLGGDRSPGNICLMCGPHNQYFADLDYGRKVMDRHRQARKTYRGS
jgi:hypothetical protein